MRPEGTGLSKGVPPGSAKVCVHGGHTQGKYESSPLVLWAFSVCYFCASSRLTSAAQCGGIGAASASYWSFRVPPIAVVRPMYLARETSALLGGPQGTTRRRIQ
jgi:hypothetical protein